MRSKVSTHGLTADDAARRLLADGPNELPGTRPRHLLLIAKDVLAEPMLLLLLLAATAYMLLGDAREAIAIAASMLIVVAISIVQERRTEQALVKLRELSSPRALVLRDGTEQRIAGRDVVVDDILVLHEGDRVPADAHLLSATALSVDESILTGESLAIDKEVKPSESTSSPDCHNVYSGSLVVRGFGMARVTATGPSSEIGRIGKALDALSTEATPLYQEIRRIVKIAAVVGLALCALVAIVYATTRDDGLGGVLAGITLAMGLLPEEFPVVLTIFLALGAWRLSRHDVLTRRMPAIETIGAVTVLSVDKTGTLTENRMRVALIETATHRIDLRQQATALDESGIELLMTATAASEIEAFDPMERAIHEAAAAYSNDRMATLKASRLVHEYDLTPQLLAVTHVWHKPDEDAFEIAVKGAPEAVFRLCQLADQERQARLVRVAAIASEGLRVLAVAKGRYAATSMPESPAAFDLQLLGLICLADPIRADVPAALSECAEAGIRVVMITGDHPGTALAIARQAGFTQATAALTGSEVQALDDVQLRERVRIISIYARMSPHHKLRLVQAMKANGEIVAMTGDGVNDAPALKAAHVGVAMGGRGTDVAREAAAIVLLNDDFASLVRAVRSGRRIYDNLRHAMAFIVGVHIPIAGMGLLPVLLGWPLLLLPLHVLFLEFVIDPACTFVFEADEGDRNIMRRKPRAPMAPLFTKDLLWRSTLFGIVILVVVVAVYAIALEYTVAAEARALSFSALVIANLALIFVNRAPDVGVRALIVRPNRVFWLIFVSALAVLAMVLHVPVLADAFKFAPPTWTALFGAFVVAVGTVLMTGVLLRHRTHSA
jgi:P-type Ca2+ transporter type 2C